jgi:peptidoglycan/xylan/chitin deacetylase (PgdA/CDA1 family)
MDTRPTAHPPRWLPLLVALCLMAAGCGAPPARPAPPRAGIGHHLAPVPPPVPSPTPSPSLSPLSAPNAARGCAPGAPRPYPLTIAAATPLGPVRPAPAEVALTFDDGPSTATTPRFLDYLERTHTPATFFVIGNQAQRMPALIQREWRDGFAIGVHTWSHPYMTRLTVAQMRWQLSSTLQTLHATLGASACIWMWRPPYDAWNATVRTVAASLGLTTVIWNDDSNDWQRRGVDTIAATVLREAHAGAIILLHDGPAQRDQTLAALPRILAGLKARGLTPVTLPQLLADNGYPGVHVSPALAPPAPSLHCPRPAPGWPRARPPSAAACARSSSQSSAGSSLTARAHPAAHGTNERRARLSLYLVPHLRQRF